MMKKEKQPPISESHLIDTDADPIIKKILSLRDGWIIRDDNPDYRIDHSVELAVNRDPQGKRFYIQRKAANGVTFTKGNPCKDLDTDHLIYYYDKVEFPVYLVLVDTKTDKAYYVFLQKWVENNLEGTDWRVSQETHRVHLPINNDLSDTEAFRKDVLRAFDYMKEKYPGSIKAALKKEADSLSKLEPALDYKVDFVDGHKRIKMGVKPGYKPPVFRLTLSGKENANAVKDLFEFGKPLDLKDIDFDITGSPVVEGRKGCGLQFMPSQKLDGDVSFCSNSGQIFGIQGYWTSGQEGIRFESISKTNPVEIILEMPFSNPPVRCDLTMKFNPEVWIGRNILNLSYFDKIKRLVEVKSLDDIEMHLDTEGCSLGKTKCPAIFNDSVERLIVPWIDILSKAQIVAKKQNLAICFPEISRINNKTFRDILDAYNFCETGEITYGFEGNSMNMTMRPNADTYEKFSEAEREARKYKITWDNYSFHVFDTEINVGEVSGVISNAKMKINPESLAEYKNGNSRTIKVRVVGEENSTLKISKINGET